jgi:hypothetical protein
MALLLINPNPSPEAFAVPLASLPLWHGRNLTGSGFSGDARAAHHAPRTVSPQIGFFGRSPEKSRQLQKTRCNVIAALMFGHWRPLD